MASLLGRMGRALLISRPIFWLAPLSAYAAGLALAGVQRGPFETWEMLIATFPLSFAIYALNDYYDMASDSLNPRKGGIWGARLLPEDVPWAKKLVAFFLILAICTGILSQNPAHLLLILSGILLTYVYSAPPIRLKSRPLLDSLSNAGYAFIPLAAAASLGGSLIYLRPEVLLGLLMVAAFHAISTILDHDKDEAAGDRTFSVALGPKAPAAFAASIFLINVPIWLPMSPLLGLSVCLAALLSLWLLLQPTPLRARTVFKGLIAYGIAMLYFFMMKYLIFPSQLADYSEPELRFFINSCDEGQDHLLQNLCPLLHAVRADCQGSAGPAMLPGICPALSMDRSD